MTTFRLNPDTGMVEADGVPIESNFGVKTTPQPKPPIKFDIVNDADGNWSKIHKVTLSLHDDGSVTWDKESYE